MTIDEIQVVIDRMNMSVPEEYAEYYRLGQWTPWEPNTASFTGWKASIPRQGVTWEENERLASEVKSSSELGFVGQWLYVASKDGPFFYVNLPGMQAGRFQKGEELYIGDERVYSNTPPEEIERLLKLGLEKLMLLVKVHA